MKLLHYYYKTKRTHWLALDSYRRLFRASSFPLPQSSYPSLFFLCSFFPVPSPSSPSLPFITKRGEPEAGPSENTLLRPFMGQLYYNFKLNGENTVPYKKIINKNLHTTPTISRLKLQILVFAC